MEVTVDAARMNGGSKVPGYLVGCVVALFFAWGFSTVLVDTLLPKLKGLFQLNYAEAMLTQFAFFLAYFVVSLPAAALLSRLGYMRTIVVGLVVAMAGCLMFSPAAAYGIYGGFLAALFVLAAGITILQTAANPLIALLGTGETSASRLVLAQALNSFGTFVGPLVGASIILKGGVAVPANVLASPPAVLAAYRIQEAHATQVPFLGIAAIMAILAAIFFFLRRAPGIPAASSSVATKSTLEILSGGRLMFGVACIFLYVGAEVSIGGLLVNYLMQAKTAADTAVVGGAFIPLFQLMQVIPPGAAPALAVLAGALVSLYWGGAMVGRFIGSAVLRFVRPGTVLAACACGAALLAAISSAGTGMIAVAGVIAIGLCNSIQFPTIFTLAIGGLKENTPKASGLLCMAIVGGAIIPVITGWVADQTNLSTSLLVPAACYLGIAVYGLLTNGRLSLPGTQSA